MGLRVTVEHIVDSQPSFLYDILGNGRSRIGYKIPAFQRSYSWEEKHVYRLFETLTVGFLNVQSNSYHSRISPLFLGALIFAEENDKSCEDMFKGTNNSHLIIDGQQRLTTIMLLIGELRLNFKELIHNLSNQDGHEITDWLVKHVTEPLEETLAECNHCFVNRGMKKPDLYPKITSEKKQDNRNENKYYSDIAIYLKSFDDNQQMAGKFEPKFSSSLDVIRKNLEKIALGDFSKVAESCEDLKFDDLINRDYRTLLSANSDPQKTNTILNIIQKNDNPAYQQICFLACFANYLLHRVVLYTVEVKEKYENVSYDIFESLNTTGEPLTAIQTLVPLVMNHFKTVLNETYTGSNEDNCFNFIEEYLLQFKDQQKESRDIVGSFFYYSHGTKISNSLSDQRTKLRENYSKLNSENDAKERYILSLRDIAEYKANFWNNQDRNFTDDEVFPTCLAFIKESKTTLTIPILARYWKVARLKGNNDIFINAVKSITAFMILRRSITNGTAGIDDDFRAILNKNSVFDDNEIREEILDNSQLNANLKAILQNSTSKKEGFSRKQDWIDIAYKNPIYEFSTPVCKFILLCSASNSSVNGERLSRINPTSTSDLLTMQSWNHNFYKTVEHIAPKTRTDAWDSDIYSDIAYSRIGNLTLLPQSDNAIVGNSNFSMKKSMYNVFMESSPDRRNALVKEIVNQNNITKRMEKSFFISTNGATVENLFQTILNAGDEWTLEKINNRSQNILDLTWDRIAPWLDWK